MVGGRTTPQEKLVIIIGLHKEGCSGEQIAENPPRKINKSTMNNKDINAQVVYSVEHSLRVHQ